MTALVIGHHPDAQGATNDEQQVTEWAYNSTLARMVGARLNYARLYTRPEPGTAGLGPLAEALNEDEPDAVVSFHLNSFNEEAEGCEMYHYPGSTEGKRLASILQGKINAVLENSDRGVKAEKDYILLRETTMPAVICEPAFIDNVEDFIRCQSRTCELARAYATGIKRFRDGRLA